MVIVFIVILLIVIGTFLWFNKSIYARDFIVVALFVMLIVFFTICVNLVIFFVTLIYRTSNESKTYNRKKYSSECCGNNEAV